jgi:hypothetical protein
MHNDFLNQRHGTFFFIAILDGIFFALTVALFFIILFHLLGDQIGKAYLLFLNFS